MSVKVCVVALAALLSVSAAVRADEATDEYKPLMKPGAAANVTLQRVIQTDLAAAAQAASEMQVAFAKIEAYWSQKNTADGVTASRNIQAVAKAVHDAAIAGDKDAAIAAAKDIGANCGSCHMAHRIRLPDGTFQLKP